MKLADLQQRVWERFGTGMADPKTWTDARNQLNEIVLSVVECVGFHVNAAGEICDPRPTPSYPEQRNVRYSGRRRK